ncbi:MAG TPA: DUF4124 domain-containing protein [Gammaproteobacteria bacterium]|nr:DUF4124 domain-containing protein [Gammaproteobacteria bacterium]
MNVKHIVLLLSVFTLFSAHAEIYRWVDDSGKVVYSDKPGAGAQRVKLHGIATTYKSKPVSAYTSANSSTKGPKKVKAVKGYKSFRIVSPANDAAIRENAGNVSIVMRSSPPLKKGHRTVIALDGKKVQTTGLSYTFRGVDRGTHVLSAAIMDAGGKKLIESSPVTFHLLRYSIIHH